MNPAVVSTWPWKLCSHPCKELWEGSGCQTCSHTAAESSFGVGNFKSSFTQALENGRGDLAHYYSLPQCRRFNSYPLVHTPVPHTPVTHTPAPSHIPRSHTLWPIEAQKIHCIHKIIPELPCPFHPHDQHPACLLCLSPQVAITVWDRVLHWLLGLKCSSLKLFGRVCLPGFPARCATLSPQDLLLEGSHHHSPGPQPLTLGPTS